MDLAKLFQMQEKLDERIVEEKGLEGQNLLDKKILALQVELGELANEWRGFKFWSEDRKPRTNDDKWYVVGKTIRHYQDTYHSYHYATVIQKDRNPLLEEYVDCLHFILSIGNELEVKPDELLDGGDYTENNAVDSFNMLFYTVSEMWTYVNSSLDDYLKTHYEALFAMFIGHGEKHLGFTWEEIERAYMEKNEVNHERQNNGY